MVDDKLGMGCGITSGWLSSSFLFPVFLGYDLKKKADRKETS